MKAMQNTVATTTQPRRIVRTSSTVTIRTKHGVKEILVVRVRTIKPEEKKLL
jgi:hypothetical protein